MQKETELTHLDLIKQYIEVSINSLKEDIKRISDHITSDRKELKSEIDSLSKRVGAAEIAIAAVGKMNENHEKEIKEINNNQEKLLGLIPQMEEMNTIIKKKESHKFTLFVAIASPLITTVLLKLLEKITI